MTKKAGDKKEVTEKGVLNGEIQLLMTPAAIKELKDLSPTMQQFLLRWQDHRDLILGDQLKEELKDFLFDIHEQDNNAICKNIAEIVANQNRHMFEALSEQTKMITSIAGDIREIKLDITNIKDRLVIIENKVKDEEKKVKELCARLEADEKKFSELETKIELVQPKRVETLIEELEQVKPIMKRLVKTQSPWNIAFRIGLAVVISIGLILLIHYKFL